jgi:hypothetical protein
MQQQISLREQVRRRLPAYISPEVGACAAMTIFDLQQTIAGVYVPTDAQIGALARRLHLQPLQKVAA